MGKAASMGSLLEDKATGAMKKRFSLPHGRFDRMIHQLPWVKAWRETATDILIHAEEFIRMKKQLNEIYQRHTGQSLSRLEEDTDRDRFMSPEEAKEYGLIDNVIDRQPATLHNPEAVWSRGRVRRPTRGPPGLPGGPLRFNACPASARCGRAPRPRAS